MFVKNKKCHLIRKKLIFFSLPFKRNLICDLKKISKPKPKPTRYSFGHFWKCRFIRFSFFFFYHLRIKISNFGYIFCINTFFSPNPFKISPVIDRLAMLLLNNNLLCTFPKKKVSKFCCESMARYSTLIALQIRFL